MSDEKQCKKYLLVSLICTLFIIYAMWSSASTSGESLRNFTSVQLIQSLKDRSAQIYGAVLRSLVAEKLKRRRNKTEEYVSICDSQLHGRRTGNQLFHLAAMLQVTQLTGRQVVMVRNHPDGWLDRWFRVPVIRIDNIDAELCPCHVVNQPTGFTHYTPISQLLNKIDIDEKALLVCGYFQSWKYTLGIEPTLRRYLQLLPEVSAAIHQFLDQTRPPSWKGESFSLVGIHVRAGTGLQRSAWEEGYVIPQPAYFEQAMRHFVASEGRRIQFIVTSDSMDWVRRAINFTSIVYQINRASSTNHKLIIDLVHSEGHDAGFDLGLLSLCDGVIMSTGTYGWWGAWLANRTTIYYSGWPRAGSPLSKAFSHTDHFPPHWIPIGGPAFSWSTIEATSDSIHSVLVKVLLLISCIIASIFVLLLTAKLVGLAR